MAQDPGAQRRADAAALKAEAAAAAKRDQRVKLLGGVAVLGVCILLVGMAVMGAKSKQAPVANADSAQPRGTIAKTWGFPVQPVDAAKSTLVVYEDPQCPICKLFEQQYGSAIVKLATDGKINVVYQMANFIDDNMPQSDHASRRAIGALGCAIDQGAGLKYHSLIYATQPAVEGVGWTDDALRKLGGRAGLSGARLTAFQKCFGEGTYLGWADNLGQYFRDQQIPGTPTLVLDGTTVPDAALSTVQTLTDYITKNAK